jgi:DNA replication protein DnaC
MVFHICRAHPSRCLPAFCATLIIAMSEVCDNCGGAGMVLAINSAGVRVARVCACQATARSGHRVSAARIPKRYEHCTLDSYETGFRGADPSMSQAHRMATRFVEAYPVETDGRGLLITGSIGVGKTHLAVGLLLALVEEKGAQALFYDYRELLKQIQHSYNAQVNSTELDVLRPVFEAEVLVLDELGAQKPTDWVWDTVALILNTRYNDKRTTIITTNYPDLAPAGSSGSAAQRATREETLGDRIGERMRSRLAEMCVRVEMTGADFRQSAGRARFG